MLFAVPPWPDGISRRVFADRNETEAAHEASSDSGGAAGYAVDPSQDMIA
jgi:hypothetical protein